MNQDTPLDKYYRPRWLTLEFSVGLFVLSGLLIAAYLSIWLGKLTLFNTNQYLLIAQFENVSGLVKNARVEISGVQVGQVHSIRYNPQIKQAQVELLIDNTIQLDDDTLASVRTSGMIGAKYIKLTPGTSGKTLQPGDLIQETEPALNLEDLIGKYLMEGKKP